MKNLYEEYKFLELSNEQLIKEAQELSDFNEVKRLEIIKGNILNQINALETLEKKNINNDIKTEQCNFKVEAAAEKKLVDSTGSISVISPTNLSKANSANLIITDNSARRKSSEGLTGKSRESSGDSSSSPTKERKSEQQNQFDQEKNPEGKIRKFFLPDKRNNESNKEGFRNSRTQKRQSPTKILEEKMKNSLSRHEVGDGSKIYNNNSSKNTSSSSLSI